MRATVLSNLACLSLAFAAPFVRAQGCRSLYTFNYDSYATESTNGTNIFTTVITDGSGSGDPLGCNFPNVKHTPSSYNTITPTGGTTVGGWVNGSTGSMTSYLYSRNDQQVAATPGMTYDFSGEGEVICSVFGELYYVTFTFKIELARTKTATNWLLADSPGSPAICPQTNWCTAATTPPLCPVSVVQQQPVLPGTEISCYDYYTSFFLAERLNNVWSCTALVPGQNAYGTSDSSMAACTQ